MNIKTIQDALMWHLGNHIKEYFLVVNNQKVFKGESIPLKLRGCLLSGLRCEGNGDQLWMYAFTKRRTSRRFWNAVMRSRTFNAITGEFNQ